MEKNTRRQCNEPKHRGRCTHVAHTRQANDDVHTLLSSISCHNLLVHRKLKEARGLATSTAAAAAALMLNFSAALALSGRGSISPSPLYSSIHPLIYHRPYTSAAAGNTCKTQTADQILKWNHALGRIIERFPSRPSPTRGDTCGRCRIYRRLLEATREALQASGPLGLY